MFIYLVGLTYILAALGVSILGRNTRAGWFGAFLLALLVTPLIALIALVGFKRPRSVN